MNPEARPEGAFVKRTPTTPDSYPAEAAGLAWLAAAGPGSAAVVGVCEVSPDHIALDRLVSVRPTPDAALAFGTALALTHASGAVAFGQPPDGWSGDAFIGRQDLSMVPTPAWGGFYAEQRLLPYARVAQERRNLSPRGAQLVERVCVRLADGEFDDDRPPARIHGDLWSGNVMFTEVGVVLIDPAAHGGHGLTDLAMLELFGASHLDLVTDAYVDAAGLDPDWPSLIGLHQLHPLLVHAVSHGPSYGMEAERIARRYA